MATLSKKDNDTWKFIFDHTSDVFFKCFSGCKPTFGDLGHAPYYWETYCLGYMAVKIQNQFLAGQIVERCILHDYTYRAHKYEGFPWD